MKAKRKADKMEKKEITTAVNLTPAEMIAEAVKSGANLEQLEKLLSLQERWEANNARKAFNKAMAEFKANPPKIDKDKKVGYSTDKGRVGYSHASLYNVCEKINKELSKYGLSASWKTHQNGTIQVTCKITHELGHSEETTLSASADTSGSKNSIQAIGSTITYLERYTLLALTGLATHDQDLDGALPVQYVSNDQLHILRDLLIANDRKEGKLCELLKIESLEKLPSNEFKKVEELIKAPKVKK